MAWSLVGSTGFDSFAGTSPAAQDYDLPGTPVEGDLVLIVCANDDAFAGGGWVFNGLGVTEPGYTIARDDNGAEPNYEIAYKVMGPTPDSVVEITWDTGQLDMFVVMQTWGGVDTITPLDVSIPTPAQNISGMPDPPAITTATDGALVFALGMLDDDAVKSSVSAPTGYGDLIAAETSFAGTVMMASKEVVTAGSENPAAFGGSGSDRWKAETIAFRPGAGASTFTVTASLAAAVAAQQTLTAAIGAAIASNVLKTAGLNAQIGAVNAFTPSNLRKTTIGAPERTFKIP